MNNMSFMIWFSVYACAMITLGWYVSRKQKTGEDFLLGGRSLPMILTLGSTVGTMVGTGSSAGPGCFTASAARWGFCWWHGYSRRYVNFAS